MASEIAGFWTLLTSFIVIFMQTGFAMLEGGAAQSKNVQNIIEKNMLDFCIGGLAFYAFGYAFLCGKCTIFVVVPSPVGPTLCIYLYQWLSLSSPTLKFGVW